MRDERIEKAKREWMARVGSPLASEIGAFESGFKAAIAALSADGGAAP